MQDTKQGSKPNLYVIPGNGKLLGHVIDFKDYQKLEARIMELEAELKQLKGLK